MLQKKPCKPTITRGGSDMTTDQIKAAVETVKGWLHAGWPDGRLRPALETLITAAQETERLRVLLGGMDERVGRWIDVADIAGNEAKRLSDENEKLRARIAELEGNK